MAFVALQLEAARLGSGSSGLPPPSAELLSAMALQQPAARANLAVAELEAVQAACSRFSSDALWMIEQLRAKVDQDDWLEMVRAHGLLRRPTSCM